MTLLPGRCETRRTSRLGRKFTLLWSASWVSSVGDGMREAALPLLAVSVSASPRAVAVVAAAGTLPWLLVSPFSGALADRLNPRWLMMSTDALRAVVVAGFAVWTLVGSPPLLALALVAFALGCGETLFDNAAMSMLRDVVPADRLDLANGRLQGSQIVGGHFVGPLLGSALFAVAAGLPFVVDGFTFALAAVLLAVMGRSGRPAPVQGRQPILTEIGDGARWLWSHRGLRLLAVVCTVATLAFYLGVTLLVLLVTRHLDAPPFLYGVVLAAGAVGGVLAGFGAGRISSRLGLRSRIGLALASMAVSLFVMGLSTSVVVVAAMYAVASFGVVTWNVQVVTVRQRLVPRELFGRVNSSYLLASRLGMLVGVTLAGWIGTAFDVRAPLFLGGALLLLSLAAVPRLAGLDPAPPPPDGAPGDRPRETTGH
ncbi:MFS transporter [Streptomyces parvus]|uniref:MFS transporter n=1 Tax=Streptomyces TaxID=1883 RepID=UPI0037F16252